MDEETPSRPRCPESSTSNLVETLVQYIDVPNRIKYGNTLSKKKTQDTSSLVLHAKLLLDLQRIQSNLSFRHSDMKSALFQVVQRNPQWKLANEEIQDFCEKMARRIRTMAMHLRRAQSKPHPPKWLPAVMALKDVAPLSTALMQKEMQVQQVSDDDGEAFEDKQDKQDKQDMQDEQDEQDEQEEEEFAGEETDGSESETYFTDPQEIMIEQDKDFFVGFDQEKQMAWRVRADADGETQARELSMNVFVPEGGRPQDPVRARWKDGYEHDISTVTCEQWNTREEAKGGNKKAALWSKDGWEIKHKKDRHPEGLVWLKDPKGSQRCQVRVDKAGGIDQAIAIMKKCAAAALAGADPYEARNQSLACSSTEAEVHQQESASQGQEGTASKSSTFKRPAAKTFACISMPDKKRAASSSRCMELDFTDLPF